MCVIMQHIPIELKYLCSPLQSFFSSTSRPTEAHPQSHQEFTLTHSVTTVTGKTGFEPETQNRYHSPHGAAAPNGSRPPHYQGSTIALRHTTLGRTPLDERSARRRDLYLTTHGTHKRQTSMPSAAFEHAISATERLQAQGLSRTATGIATQTILADKMWVTDQQNDSNFRANNICDNKKFQRHRNILRIRTVLLKADLHTAQPWLAIWTNGIICYNSEYGKNSNKTIVCTYFFFF